MERAVDFVVVVVVVVVDDDDDGDGEKDFENAISRRKFVTRTTIHELRDTPVIPLFHLQIILSSLSFSFWIP